jgi:LmbE family N-acetylglucosaminyl deacetylase
MKWLYLSPHFDDVAFSCGGLVWQQIREGVQAAIWTICAGDPPLSGLSPFAATLHDRWQTGIEDGHHRRHEDIAANQILGAEYRHFPVPDCIYRKGQAGSYLYQTEESLFGQLHPEEENLVRELAHHFSRLAETPGGKSNLTVVAPLGIGNHVDHQLVREAAERWEEDSSHIRLFYFADFPYVLKEQDHREKLEAKGMESICFPVSAEALDAWFRASAAHTSQISTFWRDESGLRRALEGWVEEYGGLCLWRAS